MVRYIHGSADSTDLDVVYVFEEMPSFTQCQSFCRSDPKENRNIIVIADGIVRSCFKGIPDEMNNALLATYSLHEQAYPLLIRRKVPRDIFLKDIIVTRKVISPLTDTPMRRQVKAALRAGWTQRIDFMKELNLTRIDFGSVGKWRKEDLLKSIAFQLGQGIGLHEGTELYTKADIAAYIPRLRPYLYRKAEDLQSLQWVYEAYLQCLSQTEVAALPENRVQLSSGRVYDIYRESCLTETLPGSAEPLRLGQPVIRNNRACTEPIPPGSA